MSHAERHRAAVDTCYDDALQTAASALHWLPWVGTGYAGLPREQRLLILGESHYQWNNKTETTEQVSRYLASREFTRYFVFDHGFSSPKHPTKIATALTRAIYGRQYNAQQKQHLWSSVAYYNRVQRAMDNADARPTKEDYCIAWDTFFPVISVLQPGYCLFAGVEISDYVDELKAAAHRHSYVVSALARRPVIGRTAPRVATVANAAGEVTRLVFIKHPSSFFSWEKWGHFLQEELLGYRRWLDGEEGLIAC